METKVFAASLDHLHEMLVWIRNEADKVAFSHSELYKIELAAEEAIVNVIRHSYQGREGNVMISIQAFGDSIHIAIADSGDPFNPLAGMPKVHAHATLEERQAGGLGLLFIRKCLDEVSYERKNDQNILTLIKKRRH